MQSTGILRRFPVYIHPVMICPTLDTNVLDTTLDTKEYKNCLLKSEGGTIVVFDPLWHHLSLCFHTFGRFLH